MARRIVWAERALTDLENCAVEIEQDSPEAAQHLVQQLYDMASSLDTLSERGRLVPDLEGQNIRELIHKSGNYRLLYEVHKHHVEILAIIHSVRDFPDAWEHG